MKSEIRAPLRFQPGVTPLPDATKLDALTATAMSNARFYAGRPQSIGGNLAISISSGAVDGCPRYLRNHFVNTGNLKYTLIGTNTKLQVLLGNTIANLTPLTVATTTLGASPITTVDTTATITIAHTAHGQTAGKRVKILAAATTRGITAAQINREFIIATVPTADSFTVVTAGTATSSGTGGGSSVTVQYEIAAGQCSGSAGYGAGMGLAGAGLAGTGRSGSNVKDARIWSGGRFGNYWVGTPGDGSPVYEWTNTTTVAPAPISGAPTDINYAYVSNDILVGMGPLNRIRNTDQGVDTDWTPTAANQAQDDFIEGAGTWVSHCEVGNGVNLLFTYSQVWLERYVGAPLVFDRQKLKEGDGIIGRNARVNANGIVYWAGHLNIYRYAGGQPQAVPFTAHEKVFRSLHPTQAGKSWMEYREHYNEVRFHYVSADSTDGECDRVLVLNLTDNHAEEYAEARAAGSVGDTYDYPILINHAGTLFQHEYGVNDNGAALSWSYKSNLFAPAGRKNICYLQRVYPDSYQGGDATLTIYGYDESQGAATTYGPYTFSGDDSYIDVRCASKYYEFEWSGSAVDGYLRQGDWEIGFLKGPPL